MATETIFDYLEDDFEPDNFEYTEVPWNEKMETFGKEYPIPFWSLIVVITLCLTWGAILCLWKLVKLMLYQFTYTIAKAIKDAGTRKQLTD